MEPNDSFPGRPSFPQPGETVGYGYAKRVPRVVTFLGELPSDGVWCMTLVPITAARDCVVVADRTGRHSPRLIKDGVLTILCPSEDAKPKHVPLTNLGARRVRP